MVKLATIDNGTLDGQVVLVDRQLENVFSLEKHFSCLQQILDQWDECISHISSLYEQMNSGQLSHMIAFKDCTFLAPLPRAYQWVDGSAYLNHVELVRKARGAEMPPSFWEDPLVYQGGSDALLGPNAPILVDQLEWGADFEAEVGVITGNVPQGCSLGEAEKQIRFITILNDITFRGLIPNELAKGFGFFQSKPSTAFAPVIVTTDEIQDYWADGRIHLPLNVDLNGSSFGRANAGQDMHFNFPQLIQHAAKTRPLMAGTIVGSGTVSNKDRSVGSSCLVEKRMIETIEQGKPATSFLNYGDHVEIEMVDKKGQSIFGKIDQKVMKHAG